MPKRARDDEPDDELRNKIRRLGGNKPASKEHKAETAEALLSSLSADQLEELVAPFSPTLEPSEADWVPSDSPADEIPYVPLSAPTQDRKAGRPASDKAARETARKLQLIAKLEALPKDVQTEYLGPNFDFGNQNAIDPYELGLGIDRFSRISWRDDDIPNILIQIHPHLFIGFEKFREFAACVQAGNSDPAFSDNLWRRYALAEAPPYKSENIGRGLSKKLQGEMDGKLSKLALPDLKTRNEVASHYQANKLVDARTYTTLRQLTKQKSASDHLSYLKSEMNLGKRDMAQLISYCQHCSETLPEMIARKGAQTFISGEMVKASQDLLNAGIFELHGEQQIQLMNHYRSGASTGEYKSLFTHAKGNFALPNATQTGQLGLPSNYTYRKENAFDERYKHRDHFYGSLKPPEGINSAMEANNPYMYRQMDFDGLLKSDYHKIRVAISLLEDSAPLDLERCEQIKGLLNLDDRLRYKNPALDRLRERNIGRG